MLEEVFAINLILQFENSCYIELSKTIKQFSIKCYPLLHLHLAYCIDKSAMNPTK